MTKHDSDIQTARGSRIVKALAYFLASGLLGVVVSRGVAIVGRSWQESGDPFPLVAFIALVAVVLLVLGASIFFLLRAAFRQLSAKP